MRDPIGVGLALFLDVIGIAVANLATGLSPAIVNMPRISAAAVAAACTGTMAVRFPVFG